MPQRSRKRFIVFIAAVLIFTVSLLGAASQVFGLSGGRIPQSQPPPAPIPGPAPASDSESAASQTKFGKYYSSDDFYYIEKDGKYATLNLFPKKIVIQFNSPEFLSSPDGKKFLSDIGWLSYVKIERVELPIGTAESKRSIGPPVDVYVVTFSNNIDIDIVSLIDVLVRHKELAFVSPVFLKDHDLVFPAGIWMKTKRVTNQQESNLVTKIGLNGFNKIFFDSLKQTGSAHLNYYRFTAFSSENLNALTLSRLLAQDILVEWAVPDFVSIRPLIVISSSLSRPSGTMNDPFKITFKIYYDERRIAIDVDSLKALDTMAMKPDGALGSLFRVEKPVVRESKGVVIFEDTFRVYQPGEFFLLPLNFTYNFLGAKAGAPPEKITTSNIFFKISGLVPRDQQGKPLIKDIFDWRKMPYSGVLPLPKQVLVKYPKSDYRYWIKNSFNDYPLLSFRLKQGAFSLFSLGIAGLAFLFARWLVRALKRQQKHPYALFQKEVSNYKVATATGEVTPQHTLQFIAAAGRAAREMFGFSLGKTEKEMLGEISDRAKPVLDKFFLLLKEYRGSSALSLETVNRFEKLLRNLKRISESKRQ